MPVFDHLYLSYSPSRVRLGEVKEREAERMLVLLERFVLDGSFHLRVENP